MPEIDVVAELFVVGVFVGGGVAVGCLALVGRTKAATVLAVAFAIGGVIARAAHQATAIWLPLTALGGGCLLLSLARRYQPQILSALSRPRLHAAALLIAGPALAVGWMHRDMLREPPPPPLPWVGAVDRVATPELQPTEFVGMTDRGQSIPLFLPTVQDVSPDVLRDFDNRLRTELPLRVIQIAGVDIHSNCHGWVFGANRFHVRSVHVERVLEDNGYATVTRPEAGDVIVYRDEFGAAVHTGVVRLASNDSVVIESKWGPLGRFLHAPADQAYSTRWVYYRSARTGHALRIEPSRGAADRR